MKVSIGVSNRHVHLTKEHFSILFGSHALLESIRNLNQPTQFASNSFVTIETSKSKIENVRVLGDFRNYSQVEISRTDAYQLGINPPVRDSGDLRDASFIRIIGPKGTVELEHGCIIARRHIHITPKQQELYGLVGKEKVNVFINSPKGGILFDVFLKVSDLSYFEMHLDTDDANAFLIKQGDIAELLDGDDTIQFEYNKKNV